MRTFIFIPPLRHLSGGLAVLYQLAGQLCNLGYPVWLTPRGRETPGLETCPAPVCAWDDLSLRSEDLWLVPEGWSNALAPGLRAGCRCLVYVQNWAYVFSSLPAGVAWRDLPVSFLAVSEPVAWFLKNALGATAPLVRPALDRSLFRPAAQTPPLSQGVRIAWMPRKNKACALQIQAIIEARQALGAPAAWIEIAGKSQAQVADILRSCHLFLSTGFPEGLGLPPLEAMACGCLTAGFAGLGGWDYMRQAMPGGYCPDFPLPSRAGDPENRGNAFVAADNDSLGAALALEKGAQLILQAPDRWDEMRRLGLETAAAYSELSQREAIAALWRSWNRS